MILSLIWFILHWDIIHFDFWVYSLPPVLAFKAKMQRSVKWSQQTWPGLSLHFRTEPAISMTLPGSPAFSDVITETQQLMLPHTPLLFHNRKGPCHAWALKRRYQIIPKPSVCWSYKDKFPPSIRPVKNKERRATWTLQKVTDQEKRKKKCRLLWRVSFLYKKSVQNYYIVQILIKTTICAPLASNYTS